MPKTFDQAQKKDAETRGEENGIRQETPITFTGSDLIEKFRDFADDLVPFPRQGQLPGEIPGAGDEVSGSGGGISQIDIDLGDASEAELLGLLVQTQLTQIQRLNTIAQFISPPSTVTVSGVTEVTEEDVPEQVINQSVPTRMIFLRTDPDNVDDIYFGDDQVEPQNGFVLRPGESETIPLNYDNKSLYMASETDGQMVQLLGVF